MNGRADLRLVSPRAVLEQVAHAIPKDCRANIIIIGSLAVGYYFFGNDPSLRVHTKDIDCLLSPRIRALPAGKAVTERLFGEQRKERFDDPVAIGERRIVRSVFVACLFRGTSCGFAHHGR